MRKTILILALTAATVFASASDAFAQGGRGGRGGGRGGRSSWGVSVGVGGIGGYYGNGYYGNRYYGGYYGGRYYDGGYYYPGYTYVDPVYPIYPTTDIRQSNYSEPALTQQYGTVMVMVPNANAQVWFDNAPTSQQGMERSYYTPPLDSGTYTYTIRARWTENGQPVERERRVTVQAGQRAMVDFRTGSGEPLPLPKK